MPTARNIRRGGLTAGLALTLALSMGSAAYAVSANHPTKKPPRKPTTAAPVVKHTGQGPTGYTVTFSFRDPKAKSVQIKGEWYFEDPSALSQPAGTAANPVVTTPGLLPTQWKPGDVPIAAPNSTAANWPVATMKRSHDGVWTYTIPLPSGVFNYGFYVDCTTAGQTGCTEISDPANPPWNDQHGTSTGSVEASSQVYVPSDPRFGTVDYSWLAPAAKRGKLADITYSSPGHVTPSGKNYLAVYTPPGYNPKRASAYPTLYLSHGGGGNEVDWSTQGDVNNILDNLIDTGQIQPMVVVMPNNNGYPASTDNAAYIADLTQHVIPYVQSHYHVSASASQRAFSGLSAGGIATNNLMLHDTAEFGYYGVMSAGIPSDNTTLTAAQIAALKKVGLYVGGGWQDPVHAAGYLGNDTGTIQEVGILASAGLPVTPDFVNGGHEWYVWRLLIRDFLTRVAFLPPVAG